MRMRVEEGGIYTIIFVLKIIKSKKNITWKIIEGKKNNLIFNLRKHVIEIIHPSFTRRYLNNLTLNKRNKHS